MPNRWALCMLAQTQSMVREGRWRGRETQSWRERGGKKKLHSGLPAVVHTLPTLIRSSCFVFFLFFFSSVRTPSSLSLSLSLRVLCRSHRIEPIARVALPSIFCCIVCQNKLGGLLKFLIILYIFAAISVLCVRVQLFFKGPLD